MTDLDPESRHILELATAARTPDARDKARIAQRLDAVIGGAAVAAGTHGSAALKNGTAALLKWIAAGAVIAAAAAAYVATSPRTARETPHASTPVQTTAVPATVPSAAAEPSHPAATTATEPALEPAPQAQVPASRTPHRVEHRSPASAGDTLQDEIGLLHRAQAAWRAQDPAAALALLEEHRTRYPQSQLAPERDALQALSLCDLGKRDEGRRLARSVIARAPHSPLRASLEQSCALK